MKRKLLTFFMLPLLLLLSNSSGNSASQPGLKVPEGQNPGPDAIAGDMHDLDVYGVSGTQDGLAIGITTCNAGSQLIDFFAMPNTAHPAVAFNFYRMSGGAANNDRFEQISQGWVKHTYGAKQANDCNFGCQPGGNFTHLGVGCSDTYFASQSAEQGDLGSRAWINPFTGIFPTGARNHAGHNHTPTSHMLEVETSDLNQTLNPGASYFAELQYVTPDEYAWCQGHPGECNMYNNSSYLRYNVTGTTNFTFTQVGSTVRMTAALSAWTGATIYPIEPEPGVDGVAFIAYKVTGPVAGVYHYEYVLYNQNLDRAIQSFSVPLGCGATISNLGFHAPKNSPGFPNDGTLGDAGFSNTPWVADQTAFAVTWSSETFAQNQNANAIRWGTMYNFRFDSERAPVKTAATIGFFKTGTPTTIGIMAPEACAPTPSATPTATATGTPSPSPTPSSSPTVTPTTTPTPTISPGVSPSATPAAQPINLSTRMLVLTGDQVGIGGIIIRGNAPKQVLLRAIGPSLSNVGVPNPLADPTMELHGPAGFSTVFNNNWRDTQEAEIQATGLAPTSDLESAILATLDPGAYTAVVRGVSDGTGVALVEVYDLSQATASKLGNISTRAFVNTDADILIAGFILGGNTDGGNLGDDTLIVRGMGPSLSDFGVPNVLADPTLELRDNNGVLIIRNNNWQDDPVQAALVTAAGLAPGNSLESAIAATLPPGQYTALLAGINGGTGNGLVEAYDQGGGAPITTPTPGSTPTATATATAGGSPVPTPTATATVGASPSPTGPCVENFDGVTAPALPAGWVATNPDPGDGTMWVTSTISPDTAPNDAFVPDQDGISDKVLDRMSVTVNSASSVFSFRNNFDTEFSDGIYWDGYVLEVSSPNISGGDFLDITDSHVGGSFVSGGYTGEIDGTANNPLAGRMAWSSSSNGYIDTAINLGPNLAGQTVTFRFRMGTDEAVAAPGVRVDTISISNASCP